MHTRVLNFVCVGAYRFAALRARWVGLLYRVHVVTQHTHQTDSQDKTSQQRHSTGRETRHQWSLSVCARMVGGECV